MNEHFCFENKQQKQQNWEQQLDILSICAKDSAIYSFNNWGKIVLSLQTLLSCHI